MLLNSFLDDSDVGSDDEGFDIDFAELPNRRLAPDEQQQFLEWANRNIQQEIAQFVAPPSSNRIASESFAQLLSSSDDDDADLLPPVKKSRFDALVDSDSEYDSNSDADSDLPDVDPTSPVYLKAAASKIRKVRAAVDTKMSTQNEEGDGLLELSKKLENSSISTWYEQDNCISTLDAQKRWDNSIKSNETPPQPAVLPFTEQGSALVGTYKIASINSLCIICRVHILSLCPVCDAEFTEPCTATLGSCNHVFHTHCITKWLSQSNRCPIDNSEWALDRVCSQPVDPTFVS